MSRQFYENIFSKIESSLTQEVGNNCIKEKSENLLGDDLILAPLSETEFRDDNSQFSQASEEDILPNDYLELGHHKNSNSQQIIRKKRVLSEKRLFYCSLGGISLTLKQELVQHRAQLSIIFTDGELSLATQKKNIFSINTSLLFQDILDLPKNWLNSNNSVDAFLQVDYENLNLVEEESKNETPNVFQVFGKLKQISKISRIKEVDSLQLMLKDNVIGCSRINFNQMLHKKEGNRKIQLLNNWSRLNSLQYDTSLKEGITPSYSVATLMFHIDF